MVLLYMVTWIPSIYPLYVSIYTIYIPAPWILRVILYNLQEWKTKCSLTFTHIDHQKNENPFPNILSKQNVINSMPSLPPVANLFRPKFISQLLHVQTSNSKFCSLASYVRLTGSHDVDISWCCLLQPVICLRTQFQTAPVTWLSRQQPGVFQQGIHSYIHLWHGTNSFRSLSPSSEKTRNHKKPTHPLASMKTIFPLIRTVSDPSLSISIQDITGILWIRSGELTVCNGKSPFLTGKSTINGHFQLLC